MKAAPGTANHTKRRLGTPGRGAEGVIAVRTAERGDESRQGATDAPRAYGAFNPSPLGGVAARSPAEDKRRG